jgi:hypothetical protein
MEMKLHKSNNGGDFKPAPAGTHIAVCTKFIDLGTQTVEWQGQTKKQHKVMIAWELTHEQMDDGRPFIINQRYTFSTSEKATFRKHLEGWRGKKFVDADFEGDNAFDTQKLLGVPCSLIVSNSAKNGSVYANIEGIGPLPKGMPRPEPKNELVYFSLERFDPIVFGKLSNGLQEIIKKSPEYDIAVNGGGDHHETNGDPSDEIPF